MVADRHAAWRSRHRVVRYRGGSRRPADDGRAAAAPPGRKGCARLLRAARSTGDRERIPDAWRSGARSICVCKLNISDRSVGLVSNIHIMRCEDTA